MGKELKEDGIKEEKRRKKKKKRRI